MLIRTVPLFFSRSILARQASFGEEVPGRTTLSRGESSQIAETAVALTLLTLPHALTLRRSEKGQTFDLSVDKSEIEGVAPLTSGPTNEIP
jgi:hypothetical protein